eukprot:scaffold4976_cov161-Amphora_coffeaeformis.AAC.6
MERSAGAPHKVLRSEKTPDFQHTVLHPKEAGTPLQPSSSVHAADANSNNTAPAIVGTINHLQPRRSDSESSTELAVNLVSSVVVSSSPLSSIHHSNNNVPSWRETMRGKLYHRSREEASLLHDFKESQSRQQLLLISGASGTGKSRFVQSVLQHKCGNGYFLTGKFDRHSSATTPYSAYVRALTELTGMVLDRGADEIRAVHEAIESAVGSEQKWVLTSMVPALEQILGHANVVVDTNKKSDQAAIRFNYALRASLRAICSKEKPLVLFLDDLHNCKDNCSLDVLYSLAVDDDYGSEGLILVAACDDSSVTPDSYLASKLRDMEDNNITITNIPLRNFAEEDIQVLLNDAVELDEANCTDLAQITYERTQGNILHVVEFLRWLEIMGILTVEPSSKRMVFDFEKAKNFSIPDKCRGLILDQMMKLPQHTQDVLKVAACLGFTLNERLIQFVLDFDIYPILGDLLQQGFLTLDPSATIYVFEHDEVQRAAYTLIADHERERLHLEIARRIWRKLSEEELTNHLFLLLAHFKIGKALIRREQEQVAVATLCLHAGLRAAKASSFQLAADNLEVGLYLMNDPRLWRSEYELVLNLHNSAGECHMCTGNVERMEDILEEVFAHARTENDKLQAFLTRIYAFSYGERQIDAIDLGVKVLKDLGEKFPRRLCLASLVAEYKGVKKLICGKTDEQLLRAPRITNETKLQCLQLLNVIILPCIMERPKFAPFVLLKVMQITLQHGLSALAPAAFATFGMLCLAACDDCDEAHRFAKLSLILLDQFKSLEYLPRVYAAVYGCVFPWIRPIKEVVQPLLKAHLVGLETGDIEFAGLCSNLSTMYAMESGTPLQDIDRNFRVFSEKMKTYRQESHLRVALPNIQMIHHLMGLTEDPLSSRGDLTDFDELYRDAEEKGSFASAVAIRYCRAVLHYLFNDYHTASTFCISRKELGMVAPTCERSTGFFYLCLISLAMVRDGVNRRSNLGEARKAIKFMNSWARRCPENFMNKVFLMEAELASVQKKNALAYEKYICAISLAQTNGLVQDAALSCELLARHLYALGQASKAQKHFERACEFYTGWGALGKKRQLVAYMISLQKD